MTLPELNPLIHAPVRLQICAILFAADEAGYVTIRKAILASRQRTWLALTETGRKAFASHMRALTGLVDRAANGVAAE